MRALVTGGNGFLGSVLAGRLVEQGHKVRALYQAGTDLDRLQGLDLETQEGDLLDADSLRQACAGQEVVFHLAGVVQDWGPRALFESVNVGGTRNLLQGAVEQGVRRIVFTSSLAVHRYVGIPDGDESWPRDNTAQPYGASKIACEDLLLQANGEGRVEAVVVRPGVVPFGPHDRLSLPELVRNHRKYAHVSQGKARLCTAFAPNLADGLLRCAEVPGAAGQVYVIADDETPSWGEFINALYVGMGLPEPTRSYPLWAAMTAATLAEAWSGISRKPPMINRYRVALVARDCVFSNRKAKEELGWRPALPLSESLPRTIQWLKQYMAEGGSGAETPA